MIVGARKCKPLVDHSIFALIIGIDEYTTVPGLKGAVADAHDVGSYLKSLSVPDDQVRYLINAEATRAAIIQALKDFQHDARIKHDKDCILIFYAGHGGEKAAPLGWASRGSKVQMIMPVDYRVVLGNGHSVHGIPDRTISRLIDDLAENIHNIVVIFDCCHSGGANRAQGRARRSVDVPDDLPANLDRDIWAIPIRGRGIYYDTGFLHKGCRSHVFLAACSTDENAYENFKTINGETVKRGEFTYALLSLLRRAMADQLTYAELLNQIVLIPEQNPQCGGLHRDRILFRTSTWTRSRDLHRLCKYHDKYVMDAGAAYGITEKAQFTLYRDEQSARQNIPLGTLPVTKVNAFDSELHIPSHAEVVALQTKAGIRPNLLLHIPRDNSRLDPVFKAVALMECTAEEPRNILLVERDGATLGILLSDDGRHLIFDVFDKRVTEYGLTRIPHRTEIKVDDITAVLSAAARYYWHLNRTVDNPRLAQNIDIEFTALEDDWDHIDENFQAMRCPRGPNLLKDGDVHVNADTDDFYGMKITNRAPLPLYVSVFYFDNSDLSIISYYQPGCAGKSKPDPCLKANGGFLTIGYGAGESAAFSYTLKDRPIDQMVDVGFIKVFLTTDPVDLSNVPQTSPFIADRKHDSVPRGTPKMWLDTCIRIIQHRVD